MCANHAVVRVKEARGSVLQLEQVVLTKKAAEGEPTLRQQLQDKSGEFVKYLFVDAGEYFVEVHGVHKDKSRLAYLFLEVYAQFRVSIVPVPVALPPS